MVHGKYGSASYKTKQNKPRPKSEWYVVEGTMRQSLTASCGTAYKRCSQRGQRPLMLAQSVYSPEKSPVCQLRLYDALFQKSGQTLSAMRKPPCSQRRLYWFLYLRTACELIEQYTNLEHLTREIVEILIDYISVGKRIPGTRDPPAGCDADGQEPSGD